MTKRYRVKTAYLDRRVGDEVGCTFDEKFDRVALQAGFLEEVKEPDVVEDLARFINDECNGCLYKPRLADSILTYLRGTMPKRRCYSSGKNCQEDIFYDLGIADCLKALGEGE